MDKGIRPYVNAKFVELNEQRRRNLIGNTVFRKAVIADAMEQFGITLASAATHYNHAFKTIKEANAELVSGLGRSEDKKGGRKPKSAVVAATVAAIVEADATATPAAAVADVEYVEPVQTVFKVCKKSDGTVIAEGLSFEDAIALVNRAAAQKKAKLYYV